MVLSRPSAATLVAIVCILAAVVGSSDAAMARVTCHCDAGDVKGQPPQTLLTYHSGIRVYSAVNSFSRPPGLLSLWASSSVITATTFIVVVNILVIFKEYACARRVPECLVSPQHEG